MPGDPKTNALTPFVDNQIRSVYGTALSARQSHGTALSRWLMTGPAFPDGVIAGTRHLYAVRVYYEDTDLSGITYHANYLRWFERARSDLLRRLKIDQRAAIEAGEGAYAVSELNIKYLRPARLDDDIIIETRCTQMRAASCRMAQVARRGDDLLAEASLRVGFVAPDGRPVRQPEEWRNAFAKVIEHQENT